MAKTIMSNKDAGAFCTSLGYMLHAGIPNADALNLLAKGEKRQKYKTIFTQMAEKADYGATVSEVIKETDCFDEYIGRMIAVGEQTGKTEDALEAVAESCEKKAALDRQIKSAIVYPAVLLLVMLVVIAVLLMYVLPIFDDVYAQLGSGLTGVAGWLLNVGRVLSSVSPLVIAIFAAAAAFLGVFAASDSFRQRVVSAIGAKGKADGIRGSMDTAKFAQGLAMCMSSGFSADEAVKAAAELPGNASTTAAKCEKYQKLVEEGKSFADALGESGLLPAAECYMLEAGSRGGAGDKAMNEISRRLTEESDAALTDRIERIEPAMVIISSALVGVILLSVMLPLINIMAAIA